MKLLVTGASGFVGGRLCERLAALGHEVLAVSRSNPKLDSQLNVKWVAVDLAKDFSSDTQALFTSVDAVFHVAAKVDMWGAYDDFYNTNVLGTRRVLEACKLARVPKLIYTSSPSVVAGSGNLAGVNETTPYPEKFLAYYPKTKALAEREVLAANKEGELLTIALRPHLIFGPGDKNLIPTILERADAGKLLQIGDGSNLSDFTYIDDCVEAHILALKALENNSAAAAGRTYFISQGEPWPLWKWVNTLLELTGRPRLCKRLPFALAYGVAAILEMYQQCVAPEKEPLLTRFLVCEMSTSHYFDLSAAKNNLGYLPSRSMQSALEIAAQDFKLVN